MLCDDSPYLQHCADVGGTRATLLVKSTELLWFACHLDSSAPQGVDLEKLQEIVRVRQSIYKGATTARRLTDIARPWLRFPGWWRVPVNDLRSQNQLDQYVVWMRDERGFSPLTVERWQAHARMFLQWCEQTDRQLCALQPSDIDHYFVSEGAGRWSRVSVSSIASALRMFLRHAAPWRPITPGAIYDIVNRKLVALGIQVAHHGPHALRHACAARLVADGLTPRRIQSYVASITVAVICLRRPCANSAT